MNDKDQIMKRFLLLFIVYITCISNSTNAAHITGGKFRYFYLGGNQFKIQLQLERDCASGGATFDNNIRIGMYARLDNRKIAEFILVTDSIVNVLPMYSDCLIPTNRCYEVGYFSDTVNTSTFLLLSQNFDSVGYYFNWERCCLNDDILNIIDPGATPFGAILDIPKLTLKSSIDTPYVNSSPYLEGEFNPLLCINKNFNYDLSFTDPDGDSLVYEMIRPFAGGYTSAGNPQQRIGPKPYEKILWEIGFDDTTVISAEPKLKIDRQTGVLSAKPNALGRYIFAIAVHEYRSGVQLGTVYYESMLMVNNCLSSIIEHPKNQIAAPNSTVRFMVKHTDASSTYQWVELKDSSSKILVGETNDTLTLQNVSTDMHNNKYRCIIYTSKACVDTSNYATLNILGVGIENHKIKDIELYPNPSQSLVYFSDHSPKNVMVYSIEGKLLKKGNNQSQIDISDLSNGIYIIKLESLDGKQSWVRQMMKQ